MINYYLGVLKKYVVFSGRARRAEYWYFILASTIISAILAIIEKAVDNAFINSLYSFVVLLPSLAVAVRRLHDTGKSGWFLLIPIYNLILLCTAGVVGPNEYGVDPKNPDAIGGFDNDTLDGHLIS